MGKFVLFWREKDGKEEFNKKQIEGSTDKRIRQEEKLLNKFIETGKYTRERFEKTEPESINNIWTKYIRIILSYRDEYKNDYMAVYSDFIDYKNQSLKEDIEKSYKFNDDKKRMI